MWPSDVIWRQGSRSTLAQVMAYCLMAPRSSLRSSDFHLRAILPEIHQPSITRFSTKITFLKFHSNLQGANELINQQHSVQPLCAVGSHTTFWLGYGMAVIMTALSSLVDLLRAVHLTVCNASGDNKTDAVMTCPCQCICMGDAVVWVCHGDISPMDTGGFLAGISTVAYPEMCAVSTVNSLI